jgi:NADH-quinone oxidoreductase subunit N
MTLDFTNPADYLLAMLPEVVLSIWAMLVLLVDVFRRGSRSEQSGSGIGRLVLAGVLLAAAANGWLLTLDESGTSGVIALDAFRVFTNFLILLAVALFVVMADRYLDEEHLRYGELYVLVLFAAVGMMVFAGSRELMVIFIGLELLSVPVYVLTGANRRDQRSAEGALKYFLLGAFSSAFFLFGIALVYGGAGTTNLVAIAEVVGVDGLGSNGLLVAGIALLAVGFAFKTAAVPFHMWTPDAYEGAPLPITGFMAAAVKAAAFAAFLRVFLTAFGGLYETWDAMAIWLAILTMVIANLVALVEGNVKRLLAYSSIAHAGYLLVALAAASQLGSASVLFYLTVYTLMTMGAFAVVMAVAGKGEARLNLDAYRGLGWSAPLPAIVMTVFLLSLAGFPFTGGFIGKVFILRAAVEQGLVLLAVILVLASLVSYFYYLRVAWYMWFSDPEPDTPDTQRIALTPALRITLVAAAVLIVLLGVFPGGIGTDSFRIPGLIDAAEIGGRSLVQATSALGLSAGR